MLVFEYLHGKNILFRDLKPENLIIDKDEKIKLIDYWFAKKIKDRTYSNVGICEYKAPELRISYK